MWASWIIFQGKVSGPEDVTEVSHSLGRREKEKKRYITLEAWSKLLEVWLRSSPHLWRKRQHHWNVLLRTVLLSRLNVEAGWVSKGWLQLRWTEIRRTAESLNLVMGMEKLKKSNAQWRGWHIWAGVVVSWLRKLRLLAKVYRSDLNIFFQVNRAVNGWSRKPVVPFLKDFWALESLGPWSS